MRKLNILKTVLDLFYFFSIIAAAGLAIFAVMILFGGEPIPIKIKGEEITIIGLGGKLLIICVLLSFAAFVYAIHLLRRVVIHFVKREIFHEKVVLYFNQIGICLIATTLLQYIPLFFYNMIYRNNVEFGFEIGGFDSFLLSIGLGLFFMVLSEIFKIAKNLKEDNELVV